jgi:hypothetical protein
VQEFLAARLHNVFGQNLDMGELVRRSRAAILDTVEVRTLAFHAVRCFDAQCYSCKQVSGRWRSLHIT